MCGIWSIISLLKNDDLRKYLSDFWKIQNRGPDNSSLLTYPQAVVGFHRLAIMDVSFESNQPYIFQDNLKTIVFICNGEIYNFKELAHEYNINIGKSDCAIIPKLYMKLNYQDWLKLFTNKIKGEFAFVLLEFDRLKNLNNVIVGRDMIGIRPLYYHNPTKNSTKLIFSSEIKGTTSFEDKIEEYSPGTITKFSLNDFGDLDKEIIEFKYVYNINEIREKSQEYYLQRIRTAVINSVKRRLEADRPIAFLLSGGVDSSLVCAIASRLLGRKIKTYCCGFSEGLDLEYAKKVANHIDSNHTEVIFKETEALDSVKDVIKCIESYDTTTVRASMGQYLVSKYISETSDNKVILVGEGPDEVCSSYLFNYYVPNGEELHELAKDLVDKLHIYDVRRVDRCVSNFGLEARVPLLDPEVIEAYWEIPREMRHPKYKGIEKYWLRKAFDGMNLLPNEILWRKKEAFSDGVSGKSKSWFQIIQDDLINYEGRYEYKHNLPETNEQKYFRDIFLDNYPDDTIIKDYWIPRYNENGKVEKYMDPSARVLDIY